MTFIAACPNRRMILAGALAAAAPPFPALSRMPRRPGLQLYTVGDMLGRDPGGTLAAVRTIGFEEVELPGLLGRSASEWAKLLKAADLRCPSAHVPLEGNGLSLANPPLVIDTLRTLGANFAVVPLSPVHPVIMQGETWFAAMARAGLATGQAGWTEIGEKLNTAGAALAEAGITVGYHNHDLDLHPLAGGSTPLEILLEATNPDHVTFEMDIGWVAAAGRDPVDLLARYPGRFRLLHLKDTGRVMPASAAFRMEKVEPGRGIVDWRAITKALRTIPVDHAFVEQEPPFQAPSIEAAKQGFSFFRTLG